MSSEEVSKYILHELNKLFQVKYKDIVPELKTKLDKLLFFPNSISTFKSKLEKLKKDSSSVCAYQLKVGEPAYQCKTCQTDPTCIQCIPCYNESDHKGHEVIMNRASGGGCCDCGDIESWKKEGFCKNHRGREKMSLKPYKVFDDKILISINITIKYVLEIILNSLAYVNNTYLFNDSFKILTSKSITDIQDKNFILFIHNINSITFEDAMTIFYKILSYNVTDSYKTALCVNMYEYTNVAVNKENDIISLREKLAENNMTSTMVEVKNETILISERIFNECVEWLLNLCKISEVFRRIIFNLLQTKLHSNQINIKSPFTIKSREEIFNSIWSTIDDPHITFGFWHGSVLNQKTINFFDSLTNCKTKKEMISILEKEAKKSGKYFIYYDDNVSAYIYIDCDKEKGIRWTCYEPLEFSTLAKDSIQTSINNTVDKYFLDFFIKYDRRIPKNVRRIYTEFMFQLMIDIDFKEFWGISFIKYYKFLSVNDLCIKKQGEFISINSVFDYSVQLLTINKITFKLIVEYSMLKIFLSTIKELTNQIKNKNGEVILKTSSSQLYRIYIILNDYRFIINKELVQFMLFNANKGHEVFLIWVDILELFENLNPIKRKTGNHEEFPSIAWRMSYFMEDKLFEVSLEFLNQLKEILFDGGKLKQKHTNKKSILKLISSLIHKSYQNHKNLHSLNPNLTNGFNTSIHYISFNLPMNRFINSLLMIFLKSKIITSKEIISIFFSNQIHLLSLIEQPLRLLSAVAQIDSNLWLRNGLPILSQLSTYFCIYNKFMFNGDIHSIQLGICTLKVKSFIETLFSRFLINEWLNDEIMNNRYIWLHSNSSNIVEKLLFFILKIYTNRYYTSDLSFNDILKNILIQKLIYRPYPFSCLSFYLKNIVNTENIKKILNEISTFTSATSNKPGKYVIKLEYLKDYDPYFFAEKSSIENFKESYSNLLEKYNKNLKNKNLSKTLHEMPPKILPPLSENFKEIYKFYSHKLLFQFLDKIIIEFTLNRDPYINSFKYVLDFITIGIFEYHNHNLPEDISIDFKNLLYKENMGNKSSIIDKLSTIHKKKLYKFSNLFMDEIDQFLSNDYFNRESKIKKEKKAKDAKRQKLLNKRKNRAMKKMREKANKYYDNFVNENDIKGIEEDICFYCKGSSEDSGLLRLCYLDNNEFLKYAYLSNDDRIDMNKPKYMSESTYYLSFCGHHIHSNCYDDWYVNLIDKYENEVYYEGMNSLNINDKNEILCPLCKSIGNILFPVIPLKPLNFELKSNLANAICYLSTSDVKNWLKTQIDSNNKNEIILNDDKSELNKKPANNFLHSLWKIKFTNNYLLSKVKIFELLHNNIINQSLYIHKSIKRQDNLIIINTLEKTIISLESHYRRLSNQESNIRIKSDLYNLSQILAGYTIETEFTNQTSFFKNDEIKLYTLLLRHTLIIKSWCSFICAFYVKSYSKTEQNQFAALYKEIFKKNISKSFFKNILDEIHTISTKIESNKLENIKLEEYAFIFDSINKLIDHSYYFNDIEYRNKNAYNLLITDPFTTFLYCLITDNKIFELSKILNNDVKEEILKNNQSNTNKFNHKNNHFVYALNFCWFIKVIQTLIYLFSKINGCSHVLDSQHNFAYNHYNLNDNLDKKENFIKIPKKMLNLLINFLGMTRVNNIKNEFNIKWISILCLPFLRSVCFILSACNLCNYDLLTHNSKIEEYLEAFKLSSFDKLISSDFYLSLFSTWFSRLNTFTSKIPVNKKSQLKIINSFIKPAYIRPSLYELPYNYDVLFQMTYNRKCSTCKNLSKYPSICLLCGEFLCAGIKSCVYIKKNTPPIGGLTLHSLKEHGSSIFLLIKENMLVLIKNGYSIEYPSPYLDKNGETDRGLVRGNELTLNESRWNTINNLIASNRLSNEVHRRRNLVDERNDISRNGI